MSSDNSINISDSNLTGDIFQGNIVQGGIKNTYSSDANHQLVKVLSDLKASLANDTALKESYKAEIMAELKVLEKAVHSPNDNNSLNIAQRSLRTLKGIMIELPNTNQFSELFNYSLPSINNWFGF